MIENQYHIAIADDHNLILSGIRNIILDNDLGTIIGEANNGIKLLQLLQNVKPNLVILDVNMPELNGVQTAKKITEMYPNISILMLSLYENIPLIKELHAIGVKGYLSKSFEIHELVNSIKTIKNGQESFPNFKNESLSLHQEKTKLTSREIEVLSLIAQGQKSKDIAINLYLSQYTVETHRKNLMRKLEVNSISSLLHVARDLGYLLEK